jgi:5,5'-dehydrodivanillate O-demethylase
MLRKRFLEELEAIDSGKDPKGVIRDNEVNRCVPLPIADRKAFVEGLTWDQMMKHPLLSLDLTKGYPFQTGQPDDVRQAFEDAMGITAYRSSILASNSTTSSP